MAGTTKYGLKKRGGETYHYDFTLAGVRYTGDTGKTNYRDALSETEATRSAAKAAATAAEEVKRLFKGGEIAFGLACANYMTEKGNSLAKADELVKHLAWIEQHLERGADTLLSEINNPVVARLKGLALSEPAKKGHNRKATTAPKSAKPQRKTNSTINRHLLQPLRQLMRWARLSWDCNVGAVHWAQHMLKEESVDMIPRHAEMDEEALIIGALGHRGYEVAAKYLFMTGCRIDEMIGLVWERVKFKQRVLYVLGKRNKLRPIPMTQELYDLLWAQKGFHDEYVFTFIAERTSARAVTVEGERYPMRHAGFNSHWRRALKKVGISDFRIHDTRHTKGTRLLRATGRLEVVKKLLGHSNLKTTERYAHVLTDDVLAALEQQDRREQYEVSRENHAAEVAPVINHLKLITKS